MSDDDVVVLTLTRDEYGIILSGLSWVEHEGGLAKAGRLRARLEKRAWVR